MRTMRSVEALMTALATGALLDAQAGGAPPKAVFCGGQVISPAEAIAVSTGDVDGDGDPDVLTLDCCFTILWCENTAGNGSSWATHTVTSSALDARSVVAADIDGDGDQDVLSASFGTDGVAWYENVSGDGSLWTTRPISSVTYAGWSIFAADVDGDEDLDVLSAPDGLAAIAWCENVAGDGSAWVTHTIPTAGAPAWTLLAEDLDGDGDADLLSASPNDDRVDWYENLFGDGSAWTLRTITGTADEVRSVFAVDVDGDGDVDVLSSSYGDDRVAWHENLAGDGSAWSAHTITSAATATTYVIGADVDGDGDTDAVSNVQEAGIAWYENAEADGSTWTMRAVDVWPYEAAVWADDVDSDGDVDLLSAAAAFDDHAAWYENLSSPAFERLRLGRPANPHAFLPGRTSGPVLGGVWDPAVDHTTFAPAAIVDLLFISLAPTNVITPIGTVLAAPPVFIDASLAGEPFAIPIQLSCTYVGTTFYAQAAALGLSTLAAANGLDITIGTF